jgi:hypothetical protein
MQDVQLYINEEKSLSGTVTYGTSYNLSDNTKDFNENDWVVGSKITNIASGETANIVSIYSSVTIVLDKLISVFGSGSYIIEGKFPKRLDLFKDETISLTQTIKNIKDISKIQTDFSQKFTIPASKNNNKIFKHYYNSFVSDGFDARILKSSTIKLNGVDFKEGKIRLLGVKMKDNKAYAYDVGFVGNTVSLKDMFSDDELTDLPYLDVFNHVYSYANVKTYMQSGFHLGTPNTIFPDMMYPFISCKSRYYLDTGQTSSDHEEIENVRNIYNHQPGSINEHNDYHSILYTDLKPAIKVKHILTAIEQKYGFTFSDDFFDPQTNIETRPQFDQLYLFCNRKAGSLDDLIDETSGEVKFEGLTKSSGTEVREDNNTSFKLYTSSPSGGRTTYKKLNYQATISVVGTGAYDFELYDVETNEIYAKVLNQTGSLTFNVTLSAPQNQAKIVKPSVKIKTKAGINSFSLGGVALSKIEKLTLQDTSDTITSGFYYSTSVTLGNGLDFRNKLLPKIKVLDFMKGLFNMFNLVAYFEDNVLVVKTLDDYYLTSSHNEYNIDKYVDSSTSQVNRSDIYSEINYEYEKPKTIFAIKSNEATNDEYGNERFKSEGDNAFDGGKYDVKVKFGHMLYENIIDQDTEEFSNVLWGYSVDKDENPALEAPTLFFAKRSDYYGNLTNKYYVTNKPVGITGSYTNDVILYLYRPSNTYFTLSNNKHSINFGEEYDSLTNQAEPDGLFKIYHQNFIQNIYAQNARILKISAHLPLSILLKYKLNDRFIVGGKKYLINSAKTNLQTGKTELELLTDNYIEE